MTAWPSSARKPLRTLAADSAVRRFRGGQRKAECYQSHNKVQKAQKTHHPHSKIAAAGIKGRRKLCHPSCQYLRRPRATAGQSKGRTALLHIFRFILLPLILQAS